ncbi:MAG TPA: glycosyltransferase [Candidatus Binatia bacterium]|nr:glycosyltransferase [Candidatus Binatia bacterium]
MIPKKIHYCWFSESPKSRLVKNCMRSWEKYLPDYEIVECTTKNFDIYSSLYAKEAYSVKKYAFVADFARFYLAYNYGGIYLDSDVELLKGLDNFLNTPAFCGYEAKYQVGAHILGSQKKGEWAKEVLEAYEDRHFIIDGKQDLTLGPRIITQLMVKKGLKQDDSLQVFGNLVHVYPQEYFMPIDFFGRGKLTENSYCIHHCTASWMPKREKLKWRIIGLAMRLGLAR